MAKSVDAQDLKSCGSNSVPVQVRPEAPQKKKICGSSSVGRASAFQAECREFDPRFPLQKKLIMVTVVQLVERQFVALVVAGSIPVGHPICVISSVGRAHDF